MFFPLWVPYLNVLLSWCHGLLEFVALVVPFGYMLVILNLTSFDPVELPAVRLISIELKLFAATVMLVGVE